MLGRKGRDRNIKNYVHSPVQLHCNNHHMRGSQQSRGNLIVEEINWEESGVFNDFMYIYSKYVDIMCDCCEMGEHTDGLVVNLELLIYNIYYISVL